MKLPQKQTIETLKSIVIAILVSSIVAFIAGMHYEQVQVSAVHTQAESIVKSLKQ